MAPASPGIYVLRMSMDLPRLKERSDILYIGSTRSGRATVRTRLQQHLRPRDDQRDIGCRIARVIAEVPGCTIEFAFRAFSSHAEARFMEAELLKQYETDHIEFPPLNRQESGKLFLAAIKYVFSHPEVLSAAQSAQASEGEGR